MMLNVRLFATLKERTGSSQISVELKEPATVADLLTEVIRRYPGLEPFKQNILVSVNWEYADRTQSISGSDEIALFPPVSGG